ncbi:MAG: hypothetical protein OHK93_007240 [Ramalina farinacea]|uniref:Uncharacterized protein n=1 Tax=Ramalina farinacea TaxID=258253 RepID=A0AA43TQT4_9LECA|nr:hypothetical protein [Ramalina farinacea]
MSSQLELLPRELRDQIYSEVLPTAKTIHPFQYHFSNANPRSIIIPGILIVNRKIHAEAVALLYVTNTLILATWLGRSDKAHENTTSFWWRHGSSIQNAHMHLRLKTLDHLASDEYYKAIIVPSYAAKVWDWERTALREAASNNLQTLTLEMRNNSRFCPEEFFGQCSTPSVIGMLRVLLEDLTFCYGTLQLRRKDRVWTRWEGSMERPPDFGKGRKRGFVNHLIIRGSESLSPVMDEIRRFLGEVWSLLNTEVRDDAALTQIESESTKGA